MSLKDDLRQMVAAGTDEYRIGNQSYWTDAQLEAVLGHNRIFLTDQPLQWLPVAGTYTKASIASAHALEPNGGTVYQGSDVVTGWTSARDGIFTFSSDREGATYTYSGYVYDMNAAAAEVCSAWAAAVKGMVDVSSDDQSLKLSQKVQTLTDMARAFRSRTPIKQGTLRRGDAR